MSRSATCCPRYSSRNRPVGSNVPISNVFDYNRDGQVGAADITIDQTELSDAQWFPRERVREALEKKGGGDLRLPPPLAIAHQLVKSWIEQS